MVETQGSRALEGVRVFELGIAIASPCCGRYMAHHGADVLKVESPTSPDVVRLLGSAWLREDEERAAALADSSPYVSEMNADKRSIALDLKRDDARAVAYRLLSNCDVFIANFAARALVDLGLDYESVRAVKPDIVYVQLPGFGSDPSKPYYPFVAWGPNQAPLVGLDDLTGHADREPAGIATVAPPDYLSAFHALNAVLLGLEHRDRTGEGVHVDISQFETTVGLLLAPFAMEHSLTGSTTSRIGNRSLWYAPEGVYPCVGHERWIAVSVDTDDAWQALRTMASPALDDERFDTLEGRMAAQDELDAAMAGWTAGFESADLAARLQGVGVTAHLVSTNEDLLQDEHVKSRGYYQVSPGPRFTRDVYSGNPIRLSDTPGRNDRAGPSMGEHTVEILTEIVGMTAEEVQGLVDAGAAFTMNEPELRVERPYEQWLHILFPGEPDTRDL
jgi:benzylsuccinate CoA-transferase BbsF subunit